MGATASVLAGAAMEPIKKAGSGMSSAVVAVKPRSVRCLPRDRRRRVGYGSM